MTKDGSSPPDVARSAKRFLMERMSSLWTFTIIQSVCDIEYSSKEKRYHCEAQVISSTMARARVRYDSYCCAEIKRREELIFYIYLSIYEFEKYRALLLIFVPIFLDERLVG